jgi:hypothetical protein
MSSNFVKKIIKKYTAEFEKYSDPVVAKGQCFNASSRIMDEQCFPMVIADHSNNPLGRFRELGQHSDHYAVVVGEDTILDFTLRQFDETVDFPFIGTYEEWFTVLAKAWDTDTIRYTAGWDYSIGDVDEDEIFFWERYPLGAVTS